MNNMSLISVKVNTINDIAPEKRFLVDELTIVGVFQSQFDLPILRSMCNAIVDGKRTGGNLFYVDLSECKICKRNGVNPDCWNGDWEGLKNCLSLKKIVFPCKAYFSTTYGEYFSGCKSLECIEIKGFDIDNNNNDTAYDEDGVLFVRTPQGKKCLLKYPANKGNEYKIPWDITRISDYAFEDSHLTRLFMPSVPPTCDEKAFEGVNKVAMTLVVPQGCHDAYWVHPVFGNFKIEEMD